MARRADVLVALRKLGFGASGRRERFVVTQSDLLVGVDTVIVAPLDDDAPMYRDDPLVVRVSAAEAGTSQPHVVLVHLLAAARLDRFEPASVGRLSPRSMGLVDGLLRTVLHL
ncbi:MAG: type II toxin-antitoxin system PemK/MazF family toxin [Polyangiaceae bacterium]